MGAPDEPARFVVEQEGDTRFRLLAGHGFQLNLADGSAPVLVTDETLPVTDLASIPGFLSWFVSRTGRHTPAALVHDRLVTPGMDPVARAAADDLFLDLMARLDVPPVRRTVMWAAVSLATRWVSGWLARAAIVVWGVIAVCGLLSLVTGLVGSRPLWVIGALVAPAPASLLWGTKRRAGLVGGYALLPVAVPAASSALGYATYWVIEEALRRIWALAPHKKAEDLPAPVAYQDR